ncbi:MAG: hypothetical protein ACQERF_06610 [Actinomycetota bacterium]
MRKFRCPSCGEEKSLKGARTDEGIRITCGSCGASWLRDETPRCASCGGTDVFTMPRVVLAMGRGNIRSMAGQSDVLVCVTCDSGAIEKYHDHGSPLPPDHITAAQRGRD